jgi:hypothetical protein
VAQKLDAHMGAVVNEAGEIRERLTVSGGQPMLKN